MKILYCLLGTFNSGGMERIVTAKANWLARHGNDVYIVTTEQSGKPNFFRLEDAVKRVDLDIMYSSVQKKNPLVKFFDRQRKMQKHLKKLSKLINEIDPDIIISTFSNEVTLLPKINHRAKRIVEIHFSKNYRIQLNRSGVYKIIDRLLTWQDSRIVKKYHKLVVLTEEDKNKWNGISGIEVLPNFIQRRAEKPALLDSKEMIAVGRLYYQKGFDRLIKAWRFVADKHPDWHLNIFGNGELKSYLLELISKLKLEEQISINTPISNIELEYIKSSGLIISSRYEGLPMVLLEGMAVGLPAISYTCECGPKDVIADNIDGLLVEEGDIRGLSEKIILMIENEKIRKKLGENAYAKSQQFLEDTIMSRWHILFIRLTSVAKN